MKKKILYSVLIISLISCLPIFSGTMAVAPEEVSDDNLSTDSVYEYDGNTIEIIEQTPEKTTVLLNGTYHLELEHNATNVGVTCNKDMGGTSIQAEELVFDVDFMVDDDGEHLDVGLPDFTMEIDIAGENSDEFNITIVGSEIVDISYNTTADYLYIEDGINILEMDEGVFILNEGTGPYGFILLRENNTAWEVITPQGLLYLNFNEDADFMYIEYSPVGLVYTGVVPPLALPAALHLDGFLSIFFTGDTITVGWDFVTLVLATSLLVFNFGYITLTFYWGQFLERVVILIWDITIIFYLALIELLIVIVYYDFEIKIYETQIVIIFINIEIIIAFISLILWEITFIFHFEFWFIQLIFLVQVNNIIINPIRFIFVPVIIPIFIPTIYYVPVYINNFVHIYVPYASPALYIDVYDEVITRPNHTIQYLVTDQTGNPIDDATVTVNYNGTDYATDFIANGVYEVELPMSDETETVEVTAEKNWYPDGSLIYDLNATGIIDVVTQEGPLSLIPVIASLVCLAIGTIFIKRKK